MTRRAQRLTSLAVAALVAACGSDDDKSCDVAKQTGCSTGLVCELVDGGRPVCAQPLVLSGSVFDLETSAPVEKARVVALDANRSPVSTVAITDAAGEFRIQVSNPRTKDGAPARATSSSARTRGYATFLRHPAGAADQHGGRGPRRGRTRGRGSADHRHRPPRAPSAGTGVISGTVTVPANQPGALVVAEPGGSAPSPIATATMRSSTSRPELLGQAYARGAVHEEKSATVLADAVTDVDLGMTSAAPRRSAAT